MPETLVAGLETTDLLWLLGAVWVAGMVRGFAGFGSAMIIMPVASSVLPPYAAITFMMMAELLGPLPNLRAALRDGVPRDAGRLVIGAALAVPVGIWFLSNMSPQVFGWVVSVCVLGLLVMLISGWRYNGRLTPGLTVATGSIGGFMSGFCGLPGPPVIMLYMSSWLPISVIRANFLLYLLAIDIIMIAAFWVVGLLVWPVVVLGLLAGVPNVLANMVGARLFNPDAARLFRAVAYAIIATSAMIGLPIWS